MSWKIRPHDAARRSLNGIAGVALLSLALANCAGTQNLAGRSSESKYGVKASPRVVEEGEPVPKGGGRAMVGKPYVVAGRTYVPTSTHYRKEGWASWYGTAFHGRLTANGEVFDRESVAAAHPTLPLPSYVRVTNILNRRSMIVRVNDRGPYEQSRIMDVSERVAEALDFRRRGTARIKIEYVGRASLKGSDDEKLLATLTTDGTAAPFGGRRTMLADLKDEPAPRSPVVRVAEASVTRVEPQRSAEAAPALYSRETDDVAGGVASTDVGATGEPLLAAAAEVDSDPVDHPRPPRRPASLDTLRMASVSSSVPQNAETSRGTAPVELLPPQRPHLSGIY